MLRLLKSSRGFFLSYLKIKRLRNKYTESTFFPKNSIGNFQDSLIFTWYNNKKNPTAIRNAPIVGKFPLPESNNSPVVLVITTASNKHSIKPIAINIILCQLFIFHFFFTHIPPIKNNGIAYNVKNPVLGKDSTLYPPENIYTFYRTEA